MSVSSQQQLQQLQQTQQQPQYGMPAGVYGSAGGQIMGQPSIQMQLMDGMNGAPKRLMIAKFDYDSRQLSPNVDAEQVELSFRQGDAITIYGEMDEDGFYVGELNGTRGLVPSNFLTSSPMARLAPAQPSDPSIVRSVAFSEGGGVKKPAPARQTSQSSTGTTAAGAKPAAKKTSVAQPGAAKPLAKKTSDVGKGAATARKTSTAVKKAEPSKKK